MGSQLEHHFRNSHLTCRIMLQPAGVAEPPGEGTGGANVFVEGRLSQTSSKVHSMVTNVRLGYRRDEKRVDHRFFIPPAQIMSTAIVRTSW